MEARQTIRGNAVPKALLIVLALCAAALLAVGASFITKGLPSSGSAVNTSVHPAAGTVLRQDWEVKAGPAQSTAPIRHKSFDQMPGFRD